jgi:hypothetical protein
MKEGRKKMSGNHEKDARQPKKPYLKPQVKEVQLKPEEAVLGNCKMTGIGGPNGGDCTGIPVYCSSSGS